MAQDEKPAQDQGELPFDPQVPPWLQTAPPSPGPAKARLRLGRWALRVGAVLLLAGFAVALYLVQNAPAGVAPPPHITAPKTPIKEKPANPGGAEVKHQDKTVLNPELQGDTTVELMPLPETPMDDISEAAAARPTADKEGAVPDNTSADTANALGESRLSALPATDQKPAPEPASNSPSEAARDTAPPTVPSTGPETPAAAEQAYRVQLGAFSNRSAASAAWARIGKAAKGALAGYEPVYERVDVADGALIRLRTGAFAERAEALALCARLKAADQACLVVRR